MGTDAFSPEEAAFALISAASHALIASRGLDGLGEVDATLEVDKPEVLVYEKRADGSFKLNGVEYIVPIAAWKGSAPPAIMGQPLKRFERAGFFYLHAWIWEHSPSGLFADWNPRVKCKSASS